MARLSEAVAQEIEAVAAALRSLGPARSAQELAQAAADLCWERFGESLVLLRFFATVPCGRLAEADRELVARKASAAGLPERVSGETPVLTLLGTRGREAAWNDRALSQGFRCIPLLSAGYVASLTMLAAQLRSMKVDLGLLDRWEPEVTARNGTRDLRGMLHVAEASVDRDEQGRMVVPRQDFVAASGVRSALGFGSGYPTYPGLAALFAFAAEPLEAAPAAPLARLLAAFVERSGPLLAEGRIWK